MSKPWPGLLLGASNGQVALSALGSGCACPTAVIAFLGGGGASGLQWGSVAVGATSMGQTLHCLLTAGMYQRPPTEKEGGNIKHADAATQHNNLILRCLKFLVFTITNPNCNNAKAYKRGTCSNDI